MTETCEICGLIAAVVIVVPFLVIVFGAAGLITVGLIRAGMKMWRDT